MQFANIVRTNLHTSYSTHSMKQHSTYLQLYQCWLEYKSFKRNNPFVSILLSDRFQKWEQQNTIVIKTMIERLDKLRDKYLVKAEDGSYETEQHAGLPRQKLQDEAKREEYNRDYEEWKKRPVTINI